MTWLIPTRFVYRLVHDNNTLVEIGVAQFLTQLAIVLIYEIKTFNINHIKSVFTISQHLVV